MVNRIASAVETNAPLALADLSLFCFALLD